MRSYALCQACNNELPFFSSFPCHPAPVTLPQVGPTSEVVDEIEIMHHAGTPTPGGSP